MSSSCRERPDDVAHRMTDFGRCLAGSLLAVAAAVGWVAFTLQRFRLFRPIYGFVHAVLTHEFAYGEFALSLGDVLAFVLAVFIAFWVASLVRVLLRDQVLSRMSLPRGVGNSVSSLAYYALILVGGFFLGIGGTAFAVGVPFVNAWFPPERRGFAIGVFGAGMGGTAISALTTVKLFGNVGHRAPFLIVAATLAKVLFVLFLFLFVISLFTGRRSPPV